MEKNYSISAQFNDFIQIYCHKNKKISYLVEISSSRKMVIIIIFGKYVYSFDMATSKNIFFLLVFFIIAFV